MCLRYRSWRTWSHSGLFSSPPNVSFPTKQPLLEFVFVQVAEQLKVGSEKKLSTMLSTSECINWFAAFLTVSVAIVTVNLLWIILFIKNSNLRTRGMYLVINLTIADTLVGGLSTIYILSINSRMECKTEIVRLPWEGYMITWFIFYWFPLTSLTNITVISLDRVHATFRPFRHRVIKKWVYGISISVVWVLAGWYQLPFSCLNYSTKNGLTGSFYGNHIACYVFLLSVLVTPQFLSKFAVGRVHSTMVQPVGKENWL